MNITHISSEFSPFAKEGGLGDVLHGLSKEQKKMGHQVCVLLPKYDVIPMKMFDTLEIYVQDLWSYEDGIEYHNSVYKGTFEGIDIFLIEAHHPAYYFNRGLIYGSINDAERFLYFCRASIQFLIHKGGCDVLHLHDWPTSAVAPLIHHLAPQLKHRIQSIIFTIHNIEHQGKVHPKYLSRVGLNPATLLSKERMQDPHDKEIINLMKGGIVYADQVVTVSTTYAKQILTPEYGCGLDSVVREHKEKLHGILNGIEVNTWDPLTDPHIKEHFPSNSTYIQEIVRKKGLNKTALFKELNLQPQEQGPLIISITRIVSQKSPELILYALEKTAELGGNFILLGNVFEKGLERKCLLLKEKYHSRKNVSIHLEFSEKLAHQLFAAADCIFIPSKFEPCGLTQMIGMRYGTLPLVRNTGGLKDTVTDIDQPCPTGFVFEELDTPSVEKMLEKVFYTYCYDQKKWHTVMQNGLNKDYSWDKPSKSYEKVYTLKGLSSLK